MLLLLPYAKPEYPFLKRATIKLFNLSIWLIKAATDLYEGDLGDTYASAVMLICAACLAVMVNIALFGSLHFLLVWWQLLPLELAAYLLFGLIYHAHERHWV